MRGLAAAVGIVALACASAHVADAGPPDSGHVDAGPPDAGPRCPTPPGPYGFSEGETLLPLTLDRCDGTPLDFYGEGGLCDARFLVIMIEAGWCLPSRYEASMVEAELGVPYADRGVRVVQVLTQNDSFGPADADFCNLWATEFGFVRVQVVIDPSDLTGPIHPSNALPAHVIVDHNGIIRFREYGGTAGVETLRANLDALLAEP